MHKMCFHLCINFCAQDFKKWVLIGGLPEIPLKVFEKRISSEGTIDKITVLVIEVTRRTNIAAIHPPPPPLVKTLVEAHELRNDVITLITLSLYTNCSHL